MAGADSAHIQRFALSERRPSDATLRPSGKAQDALQPPRPAPQPFRTPPIAWNGNAWRTRGHDDVTAHFAARCAHHFSPPQMQYGPRDHDEALRDRWRAAADAVASELRAYCARTPDPTVLRYGLMQLRQFVALTFDDEAYTPRGGGDGNSVE